ncbi:hypothetical protein [Sphingomonas sp.]|uniref:hypothetical protein n=1 Tax=Sphingomonas sp. TaxID=28214 RepID=UPI003CC67C34
MPDSSLDRTMKRETYAAGVIKGALTAGPVFVGLVAIATAFDTPSPIDVTTAWTLLLALFPPVVMVGALLAVPPTLLGSVMLSWAGRSNVALRLPVAWGLVGGLAAGGTAWACSADQPLVAAFGGTGSVCALVCRQGTRWTD